jgi:hypothetical protein
MRRASMKKPKKLTDTMRPEYDLRALLKGGVRGKYAKQYDEGTNLVLLDPEVRRAFRDEKAVNEALRLVIRLRGTYSSTGETSPGKR